MTKLYCYVDETGQDTEGQLFIVAAVVARDAQESLFDMLEAVEVESGKGKRKWHSNSSRKRDAYVSKTFASSLPFQVYYQVFEGPELSYELTTISAAANAIQAFCRSQDVQEYKATIVIDGLHRSLQQRSGKLLRSLGIKTKSVRGERDETNPAIRLADAVAGLVRQAQAGDPHFIQTQNDLERRGRLIQLP